LTFRSLLTAFVLFGLAGPSLADGAVDKIITAADRDRLTKLEQSRKQGFAEAAADAQTDFDALKALQATMAKRVMSFRDFDMTGNWQCRTTKLGSYAPFVVYGWFKCRVTDDGSGWMLEKLTGSQKTKGRFYDDTDTRLIYLGAGYVNEDTAPPYGKGAESDQVGYAFRTGKNEWRIEFPAPYYESKLDILEFRR
jgi:hypothetical protein